MLEGLLPGRRRWSTLALALALGCPGLGCLPIDRGPQGPTIVLVSIDTLRADALSSYGNARRTTPHLDHLAREGVRFSTAMAPSPWTIPSHASLLTSLDPEVTGASAHFPLPESATTIAEILEKKRYATGAVVNSDYLGAKRGFAQGFQEFQHLVGRRDGPQSVDVALRFLRRHRSKPKFFFLHLYDVHGAFQPPAPYTELYQEDDWLPDGVIPRLRDIHYHDYLELNGTPSLQHLRARYDAGVTRIDDEIGRLVAGLKAEGLYDEALIIVTSDHGEAFFEREVWVGHGLFLYESELHIPLIMKFPTALGLSGIVRDDPVTLVDVVPTILDATGNEPAPSAQGASLLPLVRTGETPADSPWRFRNRVAVFGSSSNLGDTRYVRTREWKFIEPAREGFEKIFRIHLKPEEDGKAELEQRIDLGLQLYHLPTDPGERNNLAATHPAVVQGMEHMLDGIRRRNERHRQDFDLQAPSKRVRVTREEKERLRALGYAE